MSTRVAAPRHAAQPRRRSLPLRSVWLMAAKSLQMGSGFVFWVVAARSASVTSVGIAAASVAAVMLSTQLGLLGAGSAAILGIGRGEPRARVLDSVFTVAAGAAILAAVGYLLVARLLGNGPGAAPQTAGFWLLFLLASVCGTLMICLDQVSIALHHTEGAAVRYTAGGALCLLAVAAASLAGNRLSPVLLLAAWTVSTVVAVGVGVVQLHRWTGYRYRPTLRLGALWRTVRVGVPNHLLTLTERLPPLLVPILLAAAVSPRLAAYWYPAWMMAWVAFTAPISVGMVQFADIVRRPEKAAGTVRSGVLWSLLLGGGLWLVLLLSADALLSLLGKQYAEASARALPILAVGLLPFVVLQTYNATCRAFGHTREAIVVGVLGTLAVGLGTVAFGDRGISAVALVWLAASGAAAGWALWRLKGMLRREPSPTPRGGEEVAR